MAQVSRECLERLAKKVNAQLEFHPISRWSKEAKDKKWMKSTVMYGRLLQRKLRIERRAKR